MYSSYHITDGLILERPWTGWQFFPLIHRAWVNAKTEAIPTSYLPSAARRAQDKIDRLALVVDTAVSAMYALSEPTLAGTISRFQRDAILLSVREACSLYHFRGAGAARSLLPDARIDMPALGYWVQVVVKPILRHLAKSSS